LFCHFPTWQSFLVLAAHGVDGYEGTAQLQQIEQFGDGRDLVGLAVHSDLTQYEAILGRPGAD
jgi:hypothetical protein